MSLTPGKRLGPYEIASLLGAGGMGEVYRARDTRLDRRVALKVLPAHLAQSPEVYVRGVFADGTAGSGKWQVSTDGGVEPRWRRDGKELFYLSGPAAGSGDASGPGRLMAVLVKTEGASFAVGLPKQLFEVRLPELRRDRYVVTHDGQRFLVNLVNRAVEETIQPIQVLVNWLPSR